MTFDEILFPREFPPIPTIGTIVSCAVFVLLSVSLVSTTFSQTSLRQDNPETVVVENAPEQEVIAVGKTIIVNGTAKGVLAFGGDVIINGDISGDVGAIGGTVFQKKGGSVQGDIIIIGGRYQPEDLEPIRGKNRETLVYAGYEEELRLYSQNPTRLLAPNLSWSFLVQRLFSLFFWFAIGYLITFISPGAVSRAVVKSRMAPFNVLTIGLAGFILTTLCVIGAVGVFPGFISGTIGLMAFLAIILATVFGRVALQVSAGKALLKKIKPEQKPSETFAIFVGALIFTAVLSIPYVWVVALLILFSASVGLVITAGTSTSERAA